MTKEQARLKAKELIEKARKTTTFEYQEYAGANYSSFEHDIETLKSIALIAIDEVINILPKKEYLEDLKKSVKNRELEFWENVKIELEELK